MGNLGFQAPSNVYTQTINNDVFKKNPPSTNEPIHSWKIQCQSIQTECATLGVFCWSQSEHPPKDSQDKSFMNNLYPQLDSHVI